MTIKFQIIATKSFIRGYFYGDRSRDSVVGRAIHKGLEGPGLESRQEHKNFLQNRPDRLWGPPSLLFRGYRGFFSGVKLPGREVDHSPAFIAEIRNDWSCTSAPPMYLCTGALPFYL
jgi:hypothetical protein